MVNTDVQASVFDRLLDPVARCFTPEVARRIAALRADPATQARLDELADRVAEGTLTPSERDEYAACVEAIDLIGLLQAKARVVLSSSQTS
ncbi:MAG: hypothetical protein AB9869_33385 [Verrucomicrobiia bacterium]